MHVNKVEFNGNDGNHDKIIGNNVDDVISDYDIDEVQRNDSSGFLD